MVINPYTNVNWGTVQKIKSGSHLHVETDERLQLSYDGGLRHFPITNYYPSSPAYPLSENFTTIPTGSIGSPSAEHHNMTNTSLHFCSLGSFYSTGLPSGEEPKGVQDTWQNAFTQCLGELQYADGGGIILNHPVWSNLNINSEVLPMLDFDDKVLGIEIFNDSSERDNSTGYALSLWDYILNTGRRCWGFCVSDHTHKYFSPWYGMSVLLVNDLTEVEMLRAYREGRFYGAIVGSGLGFDSIDYSSGVVDVTLDKSATIKFIANQRLVKSASGATASYTPKRSDRYVRVEATDGTETIYSQPIILKDRQTITSELRRKIVLL